MSGQKIEKLTPEQEYLTVLYREKWRKIALSTERIDRQKAANAVKAAYKIIGEEEPEILFFDSPYSAARYMEFDASYSELDYADFFIRLTERCSGNFFYPDEYLTDDKELFALTREIESFVVAEAAEVLAREDAILSYEFSDGHRQTDILCHEFGWFDFCFSELKYEKSIEWTVYENILQYCGRIYAYEEACLICDRPTKLSFDNQNDLHAEAEPAIEYADEFKVYAHPGVLLPEQYGKLPTTEWQSCWLLEEKNAELRRVLIQAIGYERICQELGATELDTWQEYTLLKIDNYIEITRQRSQIPEPMCLLKMTCPSTSRIHILRVPPDMVSAREAIRWINWGIDPDDFALAT